MVLRSQPFFFLDSTEKLVEACFINLVWVLPVDKSHNRNSEYWSTHHNEEYWGRYIASDRCEYIELKHYLNEGVEVHEEIGLKYQSDVESEMVNHI